ncbi:Alpha-glucosidase subunit 1 [Meira miltonrushii]|uniref:Alpha-glucosidase subunit 1 n=1 Tax=Meira miltonrushii TaxID=1280837 RepID=A0A316VJM9_9BASI|nr:Alpha-glucosidase subunit 1 [Meira miltonrushii]PWN36503.1 Alpha-glucosidase subunit 1 [Meira miltonrushii]
MIILFSVGRAESEIIKSSYNISSCPGYRIAGDVKESKSGFTVPLSLAGQACNAYGVDVKNLTLAVVYEKVHQLHVHIYDTAKNQYQLPDDLIFNRSSSDPEKVQDGATKESSHLEFHHTAENDSNSQDPWAFWITRKGAAADATPLFDTRPANIPTYDQPFNATLSTNRNSTAMPNHNLIFENQYLQLSSALPKDANVYGLGERYSGGGIGDAGWRLNPDEMLQPFFTLDDGDPLESNMYGYQPIYLEVRNGTDDKLESHVVHYQNTAGLDIIMRPGVIQYRAIGGTLDFRFFSGETGNSTSSSEQDEPSYEKAIENTPQLAMEQYVQFINLPLMIPSWAFGFHLLRWGYHTTQDLRDIHQSMKDADIPLEVMWSDIDYLQAFRDFTVSPERYPDLGTFVKSLNDNNQHYIPIIDAAIPAAPQNSTDVYAPGTRGKELDVFLKNDNGTRYIGQVWPGYTYFVDEHHPKADEWWTESYTNLSKKINFSGIWQDMNEPSSFVVGSAGNPNNLSAGNTEHVTATSVNGWPEGYNNNTSGNSGNRTVNGTLTYTGDNILYQKRLFARQESDASSPPAFNSSDFHYSPANHSYTNVTERFLWDPPYAIHNGRDSPTDLVDNLNKKTVAMDTVSVGGKFYDVHNLDGTLLMMHTYDALRKIKPDERPFIVGRSTYPGAGKYVSHWLGDNYSKWQYLAKNIQGALQFQLFGIPTVGADTCGFNGNTDEDLCNRWMQMSSFMPFFRNHNTEGAISQEPFRWDSVANASRISISKRYELLPEIYTARARSSQSGAPLVKSLWMEFATASQFEQLRKVDTQYLLGSNLLVSPVLEPNATTVTAYFPEANGNWRNVFTYEALNVTANKNTTIPAPLSTINVHLRPGRAILSYTEPKYTISETSQQPYKLIVNLDKNASASGNAYLDDGKSMPPTDNREATFKASKGTLSGKSTGSYNVNNKLQEIILLGVEQKPSSIKSGDRDLMSSAKFDQSRNMLNVTDVNADLNGDWSISWN